MYFLKKICCDQEIVCLLNCDNLEPKGKGSLGGSEVVKEFYKDTENLKWIAWGQDVGTGSDRTNINQVCNSYFPYLIYYIAIDFVMHI